MTKDIRFESDGLRDWSSEVLTAAGMRPEEAQTAAEVLIRTSLRGIDTHGLSRVPLYAQSLAEKRVNAEPEHGGEFRNGLLHYDGDNGLGQVIGAAAMRQAIRLAQERPFVPCSIRQCGHLGALGTYVLFAAEEGLVAILCQSTQPLMALPRWTQRAIGNNPLAFATPVEGNVPLAFDMAASVVARGKVRHAVREGTGVPDGWAIGPDGEPTTDAETAMAGAVLPAGGYKGIGLAMLVQILAGSLLGSSAALSEGEPSPRMGGFLIVINPRLVNDGFATDVDGWLSIYRDAAGPDGRYPGQRAAATEERRRAEGIPVPPALRQQIVEAGERFNRPFRLSPLIAAQP